MDNIYILGVCDQAVELSFHIRGVGLNPIIVGVGGDLTDSQFTDLALAGEEKLQSIIASPIPAERMRICDTYTLLVNQNGRCGIEWASIMLIDVPEYVINASIGGGCITYGGVRLGTRVNIGKHVIIGSNASIGGKSEIGEASVIGSGAILCGGNTIGTGVEICAGAIIEYGCMVGDRARVGHGMVVHCNIKDGQNFY